MFYLQFNDDENENLFDGYHGKILFKVLAMAAGELEYEEIGKKQQGIIHIVCFALFVIVFLFVIINLMTSVAVNDIAKIKNDTRDRNWIKLMYNLIWYHIILPYQIQKLVANRIVTGAKYFDINLTTIPLNDERTISKILTRMPQAIIDRAKKIKTGQNGPIPTFSMANKTGLESVVILVGTQERFQPMILKKDEVAQIPIHIWNKKFAFVDYTASYDKTRKKYQAQTFLVTENCKYELHLENIEFKLKDQDHTDKDPDHFLENYYHHDTNLSPEVLEAFKNYNKINL